jgi:hypothetical protein
MKFDFHLSFGSYKLWWEITGIEKQQNSFVNLCNFPVLFLNFFKAFFSHGSTVE